MANSLTGNAEEGALFLPPRQNQLGFCRTSGFSRTSLGLVGFRGVSGMQILSTNT
jgi:hypothetical protein